MTASQTLVARCVLGAVTAGAGLIAVSIPRLRTISSAAFDRIANGAFLVSRFGLFFALFCILHISPRGDIPAYYFPQALAVLHGGLPYRDVVSSYAPLHTYMDGAALLAWKSPLSIILLAILFESALVFVWLKLGRNLFAEQQVRIAAILYICSPISLQFVAVDGQDNVVIALFLAMAILYLLKYQAAASGALVALGAVCVKFLPLLYFPAFVMATKNRLRWLFGFIGVLVVGYGGFALLRLPVLSPFLLQGNQKTASNLTYVIESLFHVNLPSRLCDGVLLLVILWVLLIVAKAMRGVSLAARLRLVVFAMAALTLALQDFSKKSWPPYLMFALFPITLLMTEGRHRRLRLAAFALFSMIAVVAQSYWATVFSQPLAPAFHSLLLAGRPSAYVLLAMQLILVACYLWLLVESIQRIVSTETVNRNVPDPVTL